MVIRYEPDEIGDTQAMEEIHIAGTASTLQGIHTSWRYFKLSSRTEPTLLKSSGCDWEGLLHTVPTLPSEKLGIWDMRLKMADGRMVSVVNVRYMDANDLHQVTFARSKPGEPGPLLWRELQALIAQLQ
jgi:hypothetical protein